MALCVAWWVVLCVAGCSGADDDADGAAGRAPREVRHVVLLVLDACHGDQLSCQGGVGGLTPALDAVAAAGMRFDRACANAAWTLPSTASLLSGLRPDEHGIVTSAQRAPETLLLLPEIFTAAGWATAAFVQMVYASDAYGLAQGFADYRYYDTGEKRDDLLVTEALAWQAAHAAQRSFLYVHARRPHGPYNPELAALLRAGGPPRTATPERLEFLSKADAAVTSVAELRPGERDLVEQLYRGNLATIDATLAPLLQAALADPHTLLVVTSDHGEALGRHDVFGHGAHVWAETLDIPLLVAGAGLPAGVDRAPAFSVDVFPTLLELCGIPPALAEGASLRRPSGRSLARRLLQGVPPGGGAGAAAVTQAPTVIAARVSSPADTPQTAVVSGRLKLILDGDGRAQLFDRSSDRREEMDLAVQEPELVARLRALAEAGRERVLKAARTAQPEPALDEQRESDLRALGYVR